MNDADITKTYSEFVESLWGYYGKTYRDFRFKTKRLKVLCESLGRFKPEEIQKGADNYRVIISEKIESLIEFV